MKQYTLKAIASAILVDSTISAFIWLGWFREVPGARNLVILALVFCFLISLFCWSTEVQQASRLKSRKTPRWLSVSFGILWTGVFAWFGTWWLAAIWIGAMLNVTLLEPRPATPKEQA